MVMVSWVSCTEKAAHHWESSASALAESAKPNDARASTRGSSKKKHGQTSPTPGRCASPALNTPIPGRCASPALHAQCKPLYIAAAQNRMHTPQVSSPSHASNAPGIKALNVQDNSLRGSRFCFRHASGGLNATARCNRKGSLEELIEQRAPAAATSANAGNGHRRGGR